MGAVAWYTGCLLPPLFGLSPVDQIDENQTDEQHCDDRDVAHFCPFIVEVLLFVSLLYQKPVFGVQLT